MAPQAHERAHKRENPRKAQDLLVQNAKTSVEKRDLLHVKVQYWKKTMRVTMIINPDVTIQIQTTTKHRRRHRHRVLTRIPMINLHLKKTNNKNLKKKKKPQHQKTRELRQIHKKTREIPKILPPTMKPN